MIKILRQKLLLSFDKRKNMLLQSVKLYANNKSRIDKAQLSASQIKTLLAQKSREAFRAVLTKQYKIINALKLDSKAVKNNECTHTRYLSTANRIAHVLKRDDLQTLYDIATKKTSKKSIKKSVKKAVKKSAVKKAVKKSTVKKTSKKL